MSWTVPLMELTVREADVERYLDALRSGWWTMGPTTDQFEREFERAAGAQHAAAASSGTAALHLACAAADLGPGDEVIVPALTFVATAHAVRYVGAEPVLCDIGGRNDPNLAIAALEDALSEKTKAVIAVHFFGMPCELEAIRELCDNRGLVLIEDCAQALGAKTRSGVQVGTVGDFGCFSFFSKQQLSIGEGGMVTARSGESAERVRRLRSHGRTTSTWDRHVGAAAGYDVTELGFNYRLDEPHAALGISRLAGVEGELEARRAIAASYRQAFKQMDGIDLCWNENDDARSAHYAFPIVLADPATKEQVKARLDGLGVQTTSYPPLHFLTEYRDAMGADAVQRATAVGGSHLTLPIYGSLGEQRIDRVVEAVGRAMQKAR